MQPIKDYILSELKFHGYEISAGITNHLKDQVVAETSPLINLFTVLYFHEMRQEPDNPQGNRDDHLVVSHLSSLPYLLGALAQAGHLPWNQINNQFLWLEKEARSHSSLLKLPGLSGITAVPQMGAEFANGLALSGKFSRLPSRVYYLFAPEANPKLFEPAFSAAKVPLDNLTYIVPGLERENRLLLIHRWFALGWQIEEVDFASFDSILTGFAHASSYWGRPCIIIG